MRASQDTRTAVIIDNGRMGRGSEGQALLARRADRLFRHLAEDAKGK